MLAFIKAMPRSILSRLIVNHCGTPITSNPFDAKKMIAFAERMIKVSEASLKR